MLRCDWGIITTKLKALMNTKRVEVRGHWTSQERRRLVGGGKGSDAWPIITTNRMLRMNIGGESKNQ